MLYTWLVNAGHCASVPLIAPGVAGIAVTVTPRVRCALVPQLFVAVTPILPFCPAVPVVMIYCIPVLSIPDTGL